MQLRAGSVLGGCRLEAPLGQGATGLTWAAHHEALDVPVVVKLLDPKRGWGNQALREGFLAEGRSLAKLNHPAVVRVLNAGEEQQVAYLVLERLEGPSLRGLLRERTPSFDETIDWTRHLAEGLGEVHAAGLVHRDVKPENVLFDRDGRPKLVDFGLAFQAGDRDQATVLGTPAYMSPEAARGQSLDGRSDLYSLGVLLFELLCNRWPFNAPEPRLLLRKQVEAELDPAPLLEADVPRGVVDFITRALAKDPDQRPEDGAAFAEELADSIHARPAPARRRRSGRARSTASRRALGSASRRGLSSGSHTVRASGVRRGKRARRASSAGWVWALAALIAAGAGIAALILFSR